MIQEYLNFCIKAHHNHHRGQRGDRKILNGKGSLGLQHLLQLQLPLIEHWTWTNQLLVFDITLVKQTFLIRK